MELLAMGTVIFIEAGAVLGPVIWLVLGLVTLAANTNSWDLVREAAGGAAPTAPPVTRFGRPAKIVALAIAGFLCLAALSTAASHFNRLGEPWAGLLMYSLMGIYVVQFVLILALVALLVAVLWDVRVDHKRAGRDAGVAYGVIAALHVVQLAAFAAMVMSGGQML